jgi:multiple sugar transport system ATP-binding protein
MADKIVVLDKGSVMQVGSPLELYNRPNGLLVAGFSGSPMMNLIRGEPVAKRSAATIGIRPEHADVSTSAGEWRAKVRLAEHLGSDTLVHAEAEGISSLTLRLPGENAFAAGQKIFVTPREDRVHRFGGDGRRIA